MRRVILFLLLVACALASAPPVVAAPVSRVAQGPLQRLSPPAVGSNNPSVASSEGAVLPRSRTRSPAGQTPSSLRLADSVFFPAHLNSSYDRVESNAQADKDAFRSDHSVTYEKLHRISGYYERADWMPIGATDTAYFRYQASTFADATAAVNAWQDGVTHTKSVTGRSATDCTSSAGISCAYIQSTGTSGGAKVNYSDYFLQYNQCLAETELQYTDALLNSDGNQLRQIFGSVNAAAVRALKSSCLATTVFNIVSVRFESKNVGPDWDLKIAPLRRVKVGTTVHISVYWYLANAPAGSRPQYVATVSRNGAIVKRVNFAGSGAYHPNYTYWQWFRFKVKTAGNYTLTMTVNLNGKSQTGQAPLTAVKRLSGSPQGRPVTFQLLGVQTLSGRGQPQTTFKRGQTVKIKVRFTIANLSGTVPVEVDRVTQVTVGGRWQSVALNSQQFPAAAGSNFATSSFQLAASVRPGRLRFIVSLTVAGRTQSRAAVIGVT